jgi:hypothetical protein
VADDGLHYEAAARILATCFAAGVATVRLANPTSMPALAPNARGSVP